MDPSVLSSFIPPLLLWYRLNRRVLPFRENPVPYHVWVSEIMLQQTRVSAAVPYFERFIRALPTVRDLADCPEEELLKLWEGLGYYNRVRNLQKGAREVCEKFGGELPADYDLLRSVTGIGDYTAGAIGSIAFGLPTPAVDGNVLRVVSRVTGDEREITDPSLKKEYADLLRPLMKHGEESEFTQALMELGALVCLPNGSPACDACPARDFCRAHLEAKTDVIPKKAPKKARRIEKREVFLIFCGECVLLHKRPEEGLLAGLWEFPNALVSAGIPPEFRTLAFEKSVSAKHVFSHVEWHMQGYIARVPENAEFEGYLWASPRMLRDTYAIPGAFSAFLKLI